MGNRSTDRFQQVSRAPFRVIVAARSMNDTKRLDPTQALRLAMQALGGRISIPLSSIRTRLAQMSEKVALEVEPVSPGLRIQGEAHALGAPISFAARIDADGVHIEGERRTIRIRLSEVELSTSEDAPGPLADAKLIGAPSACASPRMRRPGLSGSISSATFSDSCARRFRIEDRGIEIRPPSACSRKRSAWPGSNRLVSFIAGAATMTRKGARLTC